MSDLNIVFPASTLVMCFSFEEFVYFPGPRQSEIFCIFKLNKSSTLPIRSSPGVERSSRSQMFFIIGALKNFAILKGKAPVPESLFKSWSLL